jgi:hypothetical protein
MCSNATPSIADEIAAAQKILHLDSKGESDKSLPVTIISSHPDQLWRWAQQPCNLRSEITPYYLIQSTKELPAVITQCSVDGQSAINPFSAGHFPPYSVRPFLDNFAPFIPKITERRLHKIL